MDLRIAPDALAAAEVETQARLFDLNIEQVLEHWEVEHALREIIANALDEQMLTGTAEIKIFADATGRWHVRDNGRGLRIEHFTLNENPEKVTSEAQMIGKFGVGLKDALATLHRRGVGVTIRSTHGTFRLREARKHGFDAITTLHVEHDPAPSLAGTDFELCGVTPEAMAAAKSLFLRFSDDTPLETTPYGQVLRRIGGSPRVYIHGVLVNEEPNFLFSYNITSLTPAMKKRLNRERLNVGRTTYADRVKAILRTCETDAVCEALAGQVGARASGDQCDELQWAEIAQRALNLLHQSSRVTFVTEAELEAAPDVINHMRTDGYDVVVVDEAQKARLDDQFASGDTDLRTFGGCVNEFNTSFEYTFVDPDELRPAERAVYDRTDDILALVDVQGDAAPPVRISETMRVGLDSTLGVWDRALRAIVIARGQVTSLENYAGTVLHEAAHATTGAVDVSRAFESVLTSYIAMLAHQQLTDANHDSQAETPEADAEPGPPDDPLRRSYEATLGVDSKCCDALGMIEHFELSIYRARNAEGARRIGAALDRVRRDLEHLALATAGKGTAFLQAAEARSRGSVCDPSWPLLNSLLIVEPIDPDGHPGAVGFVKREPLNRHVPGWKTDATERGYTHAAWDQTSAFWCPEWERIKRQVDALVDDCIATVKAT